MATRKEMNDQAKEMGIENPEQFETKADLQEAMDQSQSSENESGSDSEPEDTREGIVNEPSETDRPDHEPESTEQPQDEHSLSPSAGENTDWESSEDHDDKETRADAINQAHEAAQANHDAVQTEKGEEAPSAAELDGTAKLETEGTSRRDAIRQGQKTAQANRMICNCPDHCCLHNGC